MSSDPAADAALAQVHMLGAEPTPAEIALGEAVQASVAEREGPEPQDPVELTCALARQLSEDPVALLQMAISRIIQEGEP